MGTARRDGKFRKSEGSSDHGCVEVAFMPEGGVQVRDSKNQAGPVLSFTDHEWNVFGHGMRGGEFDLPA